MPDGYQSSPTPIDVTADGPDFNIYIQPQYYGPDGEVSSAPVGGGDGSPQLDISSSPDQDSGADSILPSTLANIETSTPTSDSSSPDQTPESLEQAFEAVGDYDPDTQSVDGLALTLDVLGALTSGIFAATANIVRLGEIGVTTGFGAESLETTVQGVQLGAETATNVAAQRTTQDPTSTAVGLLASIAAATVVATFLPVEALGAVPAAILVGGAYLVFGKLAQAAYLYERNRPLGNYVKQLATAVISAQRDPLVINLDGNGIQVKSLQGFSPYFDFSGNGFAQQTSWICAGSGFLAIAAPDGLVHNGSQLITSFSQLTGYDSNGDGVINASDPEFSKLVVWQDLNGDGVCEPGEVFSLSALGITGISIASTNVAQQLGDSDATAVSAVTFADGQTTEIAAVDLNVSNTFTIYTGGDSLSPEVAALPQLKGYGLLTDLQTAAAANPILLRDIQTLLSTSPLAEAAFNSTLEAVLYDWAGAQNQVNAPTDIFSAQKLLFLQSFLDNFGSFFGTVDPHFIGQANFLQSAWNETFAALKARILCQIPESGLSSDFQTDLNDDLLLPAKPLLTITADVAECADANGGVQRSGPRRDQHEVGLRNGARDEPGGDSLEIDDHNAAIRILLFDGSHDFRFGDLRPDRDPYREFGAVRPDADRLIWIAVEDRDLRAGIYELGSQKDRRR